MKKTGEASEQKVNQAIRLACDRKLGVLDQSFLCQTVGVLNPRRPHCVSPDTTIAEVVEIFNANKVGSILVTAPATGELIGIFTERDCVRRTLPDFSNHASSPISSLMTKDPIAQTPDITVAFALNLMSQGGFRHLPLVDERNIPVGILSVKDMMDFIVGSFVEGLLNFDIEVPESLV
jgi:CBS domain-containing protein